MPKKLDKTIISLISQDIPLCSRPFKSLASRLGLEEGILIDRLKAYKKSGLIRKFSAVLNHRKIGFKHNAMVVWDLSDQRVDKAGNYLAAFAQISHCYQRKRVSGWSYNLYSMIHSRSKKECLDLIKAISNRLGCKKYRILFSSAEYKKTAAKF